MNNSTLLGIALVVCRNKNGQYLTILESNNRGWWLPGGLVDPPESFEECAIRETKEEAEVDVELKGILGVENSLDQKKNHLRIRVVFYAEPIDNNQKPKSQQKDDTVLAQWMNYKDLPSLANQGPGWRGPELLRWSEYIENGGAIMPLSFIAQEGSQPIQQPAFYVKDLPIKK